MGVRTRRRSATAVSIAFRLLKRLVDRVLIKGAFLYKESLNCLSAVEAIGSDITQKYYATNVAEKSQLPFGC